MVSTPFNPAAGPVIFWGKLGGPNGLVAVRLLLDTGASNTLIDAASLVTAGYGSAPSRGRAQIQMVSGLVTLPILAVLSLEALGHTRTNLLVGAHIFPPGANADGLLGLDFLRGYELNLDFRCGQITLT